MDDAREEARAVPNRSLAQLLSERPPPFVHAHPPNRDINAVVATQLTFGQRVADRFATIMGSWHIINVQSTLLVAWIGANALGWVEH
jgi:uncharacterized membrane protein